MKECGATNKDQTSADQNVKGLVIQFQIHFYVNNQFH